MSEHPSDPQPQQAVPPQPQPPQGWAPTGGPQQPQPGWPQQPGPWVGQPQYKKDNPETVIVVFVLLGLAFILLPVITLMFLNGSIQSILSTIGNSL